MLFQPFVPIKVADSTIIGWCCRTAAQCSKTQGQMLLKICRRSFGGHSRNVVTLVFALKGSRQLNYKLMALYRRLILQDGRPKVVDTTLVLSFRIQQWVCPLPLLLLHQSIHSLWNDVTMQPFDGWMCKTKNGCSTNEAHINHIETSIVHSLLLFEEWYIHYWHPTLHFQVISFPSRSFIASQCLINPYPHYLRDRWRSPFTCLGLQPTSYGI